MTIADLHGLSIYSKVEIELSLVHVVCVRNLAFILIEYTFASSTLLVAANEIYYGEFTIFNLIKLDVAGEGLTSSKYSTFEQEL